MAISPYIYRYANQVVRQHTPNKPLGRVYPDGRSPAFATEEEALYLPRNFQWYLLENLQTKEKEGNGTRYIVPEGSLFGIPWDAKALIRAALRAMSLSSGVSNSKELRQQLCRTQPACRWDLAINVLGTWEVTELDTGAEENRTEPDTHVAEAPVVADETAPVDAPRVPLGGEQTTGMEGEELPTLPTEFPEDDTGRTIALHGVQTQLIHRAFNYNDAPVWARAACYFINEYIRTGRANERTAHPWIDYLALTPDEVRGTANYIVSVETEHLFDNPDEYQPITNFKPQA